MSFSISSFCFCFSLSIFAFCSVFFVAFCSFNSSCAVFSASFKSVLYVSFVCLKSVVELKLLANLDVGSFGYLSKFASLKSQFGNLIDLDVLGDLKSIDICSLDNLSLPSGAAEPIKQSADVIQATAKEVITTKGEITKFVMEKDIILEEVTDGFTKIDITDGITKFKGTAEDVKGKFTFTIEPDVIKDLGDKFKP